MLYTDFESPASTPREADLADAERRLSASLSALRGRAAEPEGAREPRRRIQPSRPGPLSGLAGWFTGPRPWRLAVGGALIAAVAVIVIRPWEPESTPVSTLRAGSAPASVRLRAAEVLPDGGVRLAWSADPGAEAYHVRVLGPDLTEILSRDVVGATELVVDRSMLPARIPPGTVLGWNVGVIRGGGELKRSPTATLRAP